MYRFNTVSKEIVKIGRRLNLERLLRGLGMVALVILAATLLAAFALARQNFSDSALFWTRLLGGLGLAVLIGRYLLWPLIRRPTLQRLARFLEERHPEFQDRLSTAVEIEAAPHKVDPAIRSLIASDAQRSLRQVSRPAFYYRRSSLLSFLSVGASALIFTVLFLGGPEAYRYSLDKLLRGWLADEQPPLYSIQVTPGSTRVIRHADVEIRARLEGFTSDQVKLWAKYANRPDWESVAMRPDSESDQFVFLFFDVREPLNYYVESEGIRSDPYSIEVSEIPSVERLDITLNFPRYTGLQTQVLEDEGDIRALTGTRADFAIRVDQPVMAGRIDLEEGGQIELKLSSPQLLEGSLEVKADDFYRIHLQNLEGVWSPASDEYIVEALQDQRPTISFEKPGRDLKVTNLEEIFLEMTAEDDYGVRDLKLYFSINGEPEQQVDLGSPGWSRRLTSSHTLYLEEYDLVPGDFITYYGRARDARGSADTDIYFLDVQPYDREYRQSQQAGGGQGAGESLILSRFQKEIIAATFNVVRDQTTGNRQEFEENTQTIALMQQQLQQQAQTIIDRIERRGAATSGEMFQQMLAYLKEAVQFMGAAHERLNQFEPSQALQPEQKAYQQLQRAEALFKEIQVAMGGGGSQASDSSAQELADLVDLELDKTKNQYETLQQSRQDQRDQQLDDAARKLKELAARQQQEVERRRRGMPSSSSGGGGSQQQLLEEIEELARQLARLSREKRDQRLQEVGRQLERAARDLRRAQAGEGNPQEAQMRAEQALQRLQQARQALDRRLENQRSGAVAEMSQQAQELLERQKEVVKGLERLEDKQEAQEFDEDFFRQMQGLLGEKESLQDDLRRLESGLHQNARRLASTEPEAARKLKEAGVQIRDQRIPEKMAEGSELLRQTWAGLARQRETNVAEELEELAQTLSEAEQALGSGQQNSGEERAQEALSRLGNLVEDLNSMSERADGQQQGQNQQGQDQQGQQSGEQQGSESQGQSGESQQQGESQQGEQGQQSGRQPGQQQGRGQQPGQPDAQGQPQGGPQSEGPLVEQGGTQSGPPSMSSDSRRVGRESSPFANSGGINPQQVEREWRERIQDAERIRDLLRGVDPGSSRDIANLARMMRQMDAHRIFDDPEEIAQLRRKIINGFREVELQLYGSLQQQEQQLRLTHEDEVPPQFRDRVEEYYRALAGASSGDKPR